jgi:hypothetical protein
VLVFQEPKTLVLISKSSTPNPEDLRILEEAGIIYDEIAWDIDYIKSSKWVKINGLRENMCKFFLFYILSNYLLINFLF